MPLAEILGGTFFISATGRTYRLFGNEEEKFTVPSIPSIPPILAASSTTAVSLEEALQQIEMFSLPTASVSKPEQPKQDPPTIQIFVALSESAPHRLIKRESTLPNGTHSAKEIVDEVSQSFSKTRKTKPKEKKRKPLRVIFGQVEEPFIVPFAKPAAIPETPLEKAETNNTTLKIVTEVLPPVYFSPIHFSKAFRKYRQRYPQEITLYRKQFVLPPRASLPVVAEPAPTIDTSTFRWSGQLDSLMETASNQIWMLADHLIVQSNQGVKAICFKSVFPGDGCSMIVLCAARALTERFHRVLLIDAHHRHVDLPKQLNLADNLDSGNAVIPLNERLGLWIWQESKTADENMAILAEVLSAYREEYDLILVDDGSVTENPLSVFVEFWNRIDLDGVILVTNTKRPSEMPLSHIAGRLRQHQIYLIGITENYV